MENRKENFSEWFTEVISSAGLADLRTGIKGFIVNLPWAVMTMKNMYRLYEEELERRGHKPAWFPSLIPESFLKKEGEHVEGFSPEVFWVTAAGDDFFKEKYALRPTSETMIYHMFHYWIRGKSDLPLKIYQSCQVWRCDTKATRPFLRGREFYWIEAHDAFATEEEARQQVKEDMEMTERIMHQEFGIPFIFFQRPEWDKFPGAVHTYAADTLNPDGKISQQPSTHFLGQKFSKVFDIKFTDEDGKRKYAWQTCYGPAIWRIFASVIAIHGDDGGLVLPPKIAPIQTIIIPIYRKENEAEIKGACTEIKNKLFSLGIRADVDFSEHTPGYKFNEWELKGVPTRIEIGENEIKNKQITICRRDTKERIKINENELNKLFDIFEDIRKNLIERADSWFKKQFYKANDIKELEKKIKQGGFIRIPFCSNDEEGRKCAEELKEKVSGNIRGTAFNSNEFPENETCIVCGKAAKVYVYIGRQY
jgi:prolyl-tRNA synthetase